MKLLTLSEAEAKRRKAVEFLRRIGNDDLADDFDEMSPEDYAQHRGVELIENPERTQRAMAGTSKTKAEIQEDLDEANDYIADLEDKLENIAGIAATDEDDEEDEDAGEDDENEDDDLEEAA